ncbi:hypothetical protein ABR737_43005 [Streptomyces sp. Edi2]|uniref:hypothetical protein n=1 Tax=Streptomyces sp. Edi2 TaxID=3162528 RepID=UPI0033062583
MVQEFRGGGVSMEELAAPYEQTGFVFASDASHECLKAPTPGGRVMLPVFTPPWIVVEHSLERVSVTRWPGRLFRARVVPPVTDEERTAMARAARGLSSGAGYTRAIAVDLLEELSPSVLFGSHGDHVIRVLEAGLVLDEEGARELASARHPEADEEYHKAWGRWLVNQPEGKHYRNQDHASTLSIAGAGPSRSPVGHGFSLIYWVVTKSAQQRARTSSFLLDEDGEAVLADPWDSALSALLDTAMAFGGPHLLDRDAAIVLTAAWHAVFDPEDV